MSVLVYSNRGKCVEYESLEAASTEADTLGKKIVVTSPITLTTPVTITGRQIDVVGMGKISYSGSGSLTIGAGCAKEVYPEWFGAVGDGVTNDYAAWQATFNALPSGGKICGAAGKTYAFNQILRIGNGITLDGNRCTFRPITPFTSDTFIAAYFTNRNSFNKVGDNSYDTFHIKNVRLEVGIAATTYTPSTTQYCCGFVWSRTKHCTYENLYVWNTTGGRITTCIDFDGDNYDSVVKDSYFENISTDVNHGACAAIRNPGDGHVTRRITFKNCYLYKDAPETDEIMWVSGGGGQTYGVVIDGCTFETGSTDQTATALTIYRYTNNDPALRTSELENIKVINSTFKTQQATQFSILIGFARDWDKPVRDVLVQGNTFYCLSNSGVQIYGDNTNAFVPNSASYLYADGVIISDNNFVNENVTNLKAGVSSGTYSPNIIVRDNYFRGKWASAMTGQGSFIGNYVESADKACNNVLVVADNIIHARQFAVMTSYNGDFYNNRIFMDEYSGNATDSGLHYVFLLQNNTDLMKVYNNRITHTVGKFGTLRTSSTGSDNTEFHNNSVIYPIHTITGAADNGSGKVRITSVAHNIQNGYPVNATISGIVGTIEANGTYLATYVDVDHFDLTTVTFVNPYTSGGTYYVPEAGFFLNSVELRRMDNNHFNDVSTEINTVTTGYPAGFTFKNGHIIKDSAASVGTTVRYAWIRASAGFKELKLNIV